MLIWKTECFWTKCRTQKEYWIGIENIEEKLVFKSEFWCDSIALLREFPFELAILVFCHHFCAYFSSILLHLRFNPNALYSFLIGIPNGQFILSNRKVFICNIYSHAELKRVDSKRLVHRKQMNKQFYLISLSSKSHAHRIFKICAASDENRLRWPWPMT